MSTNVAIAPRYPAKAAVRLLSARVNSATVERMTIQRMDHVGGTAVASVRARGGELVGDVEKLCYVRGPEGIFVELAERIG